MQPHLYWAALLALIIISPNLLWQYQNQFPVIHHMKELSERQLVHVSRAEFMKSQALFSLESFCDDRRVGRFTVV
ncbi:hypothetical protein EJ377_05290 [Chryseobacterium arthrosphaerae]|uniref:Uncharacterized protein n=1 Tax=Chryseobacterium arthrosphaerae TaxID=651561 RepID=A0A3S0Q7M7_9FLAO|nr:hypothetical protein EJ377_05290 [Chryseobacterium arthrosphaerae]